MKHLFLILLCLVPASCLFAQTHWDTVSSGTDKDLYSISFGDEQTGYISGKEGVLLKTTDSGESWNPVNYSGIEIGAVSSDIVSISFLSADLGYAIVSSFQFPEFRGELYKTSNGGQHWELLTTYHPLRECFFFSEDDGYLLGSAWFAGNVISRMIDTASVDYHAFYYSSSYFLYGIDFLDSLTGIVGGDGGNFYRTFDGGQSWDTVYSGRDSTIYSIQYLNDSTIIAATGHGNRSVIISRDQGATWTDEVNSFTFAYPIMRSVVAGAGDSIIAVGHTTNEAIAQIGQGGFAYWFDGNSWQEQIFHRALYDIARQSSSAAFAVGDSGLIITNKPQLPSSISGREKIAAEIKIFPNPSSGKIFLQYANLHIQQLRLVDLSGRAIKTFPPESKRLNISGVAAGIYFLKIKAKEGKTMKKIVIAPH